VTLAAASASAPTVHQASVLERLRSDTRAAHASIETVPALSRLLMPDLTQAEYIHALRKMQAFHAAVGPALRLQLQRVSRAQVLLDSSALAALDADLAWYGVLPLAAPEIPYPPDAGAALGTLYVLEGSNLGGRIIGRHVSKSLGITARSGGAFYRGLCAEGARQRWNVLTEILLTEIAPANERYAAILTAAVDTFTAFEAWLRRSESDGSLSQAPTA
jgi:heme oxygenase